MGHRKKVARQDKINTHGSWQYIEVLWSKTIGLCKKLNIIHNIIACNPEPHTAQTFQIDVQFTN